MRAKIHVTLKEGILDPQGVAVGNALQSMGYASAEVRVGKYITLDLPTDDKAAAAEMVEGVCSRILANPVIEEYDFELSSD